MGTNTLADNTKVLVHCKSFFVAGLLTLGLKWMTRRKWRWHRCKTTFSRD